jgi:HlyD family secretion protein
VRTKVLVSLLVVAGVAGGAVALYGRVARPAPKPVIATQSVTRGDITATVLATGTLAASRTVNVGAQTSGIVTRINADFNSLVKRGEVVAELDEGPARDQLKIAQASLDAAALTVAQDRATLDADRKDLQRTETLFSNGLANEQDRDTARVLVREDEARLLEDQDAQKVADDNVQSAQDTVDFCTITSPVDGVVIARNVDVGQTVTSRMEAPTLFVIATNLQTLQLIGDVDQSDVGRIRPGQRVTFTVESYPDRLFQGAVSVVRLNSTSAAANVVSFQTVIDVTNPDLRLLPGMTATFNVETSHARGVLRLPATATRFRPLGVAAAPVAPSSSPSRPAAAPAVAASVKPQTPLSSGQPIDQLFGPVPKVETPGQVWMNGPDGLRRVPLVLGISDGRYVELVSGDLKEGDAVVTGMTMPAAR